ncbi:Ras guanine nucleotide exchange factor bud5, partial [Coemansia spiralis]
MAFYYNRSDYSGRLDGGRSRDAPSAGPIPCQDRLSLGLDEETALRNVPTDASQGGQQQQQRRRERYGDALRLAKQGLPRREKRRAKFLGDLGADTTDRARVSRNRSQQGAQPVDPTGYINEVIINSDGRVSYGSWRGLIAYLTSPHLPADNYAKAFFLTFRIFATPTDLSSALVGRGRELLRIYQPPAAEPKGSSDQVQAAPVHRVFRAIKVWYDEYWYPETDDPMLRGLCAFMLHEYLPKCNGAAAKECRGLLQAVASTHSDIDIDAMATAKLQRSTFTFSAGDEAGNGEASTRPPLLRPDKRGTETSRRSSNRRSRDTGDAPGRAQASGDGARRLSGGYSMISGDESP